MAHSGKSNKYLDMAQIINAVDVSASTMDNKHL